MIRKITPFETYSVRQAVLRTGKPIESCRFEGDELESTLHLGFFENQTLCGLLSLFKQNNALFNETKQYQIRGMAILESHQKKNIGSQLIQEAEQFCMSQQCTLLWCNARSSAIGFYQKKGFTICGDSFEIPEIGPHFVMFKRF